ncbi:hypothetical protein [Trichothermofontia sp.]
MMTALPRMLKSAYRREPLFSILLTIGAVDAALGGLEGRGSLLMFGLGTAAVATTLRWWLRSRSRSLPQEPVPQLLLPPHPSQPQLPMLSMRKPRPRR